MLGGIGYKTIFTIVKQALASIGNPIYPASFDAKGDLLVGTGNDTFIRRAIGTNNQVLTADSAQSDGVKWSDAILPGMMFDYGGTSLPSGYLGCDGAAVSRATYAALFTAIGTTWGVGDGSTTFNVPNFQRRAAVGSGGSGTGTLGSTVGSTGGAETHTLVTGELAAHAHTLSSGTVDSQGSHAHTVSGATVGFGAPGQEQGSTTGPRTEAIVIDAAGAHTHNINALSLNNAGSGTAHNNLQPSAIVLKIIKT